MLIKQVILGLLSETPLTGYDLKKCFSGSAMLPWSGNNNQIYKTLLELHKDELVTVEAQQQKNKPPRKVYTVTDKGRETLQEWLQSTPAIGQFHNPLLIQLLWGDQLEANALHSMLETYEADLQVHIAMLREQTRRETAASSDSGTSNLPAAHAKEHWVALYEFHLDWVRQLRETLA